MSRLGRPFSSGVYSKNYLSRRNLRGHTGTATSRPTWTYPSTSVRPVNPTTSRRHRSANFAQPLPITSDSCDETSVLLRDSCIATLICEVLILAPPHGGESDSRPKVDECFRKSCANLPRTARSERMARNYSQTSRRRTRTNPRQIRGQPASESHRLGALPQAGPSPPRDLGGQSRASNH